MALQSSGQIKFSELNTELSRTSTALISLSDASTGTYSAINTNNAVADRPDQSTPHAISEWFSYDHSATGVYTNSHYFENSRGALRKSATTSPFNLSASQDLSVSMWIKQKPTLDNEILWDFSNTSSNSANRFFLQHNRSLNRLVMRHRTSSVNFDRQLNLHDHDAVTGTGTSSSVKWSDSNRGNTNSDDWTLITVTYDSSESTAAAALKIYWNASEMTTTAASANGTRSTSAVNDITIGNNNHNATNTNGGLNAYWDELKVFNTVLSASDVTSLYNSGVVANGANSFDTGLVTEFSLDGSSVADLNNKFPTTQLNTGTILSY
jgi:hypothetical protein